MQLLLSAGVKCWARLPCHYYKILKSTFLVATLCTLSILGKLPFLIILVYLRVHMFVKLRITHQNISHIVTQQSQQESKGY